MVEHGGAQYVENSPFVRLLATPSRVKILDVLLRRHSSWLTAKQISNQAGFDKATFSRNKDLLVESGLVETKEEGRKTLYKINRDDEAVKHLGRAHGALLLRSGAILDNTERSPYVQLLEHLDDEPPSSDRDPHQDEARETMRAAMNTA